jgi:hypothetical protein
VTEQTVTEEPLKESTEESLHKQTVTEQTVTEEPLKESTEESLHKQTVTEQTVTEQTVEDQPLADKYEEQEQQFIRHSSIPPPNIDKFIPEYIEHVVAQKIANKIIKKNPYVNLSDFQEIPTLKEGITFEICKKEQSTDTNTNVVTKSFSHETPSSLPSGSGESFNSYAHSSLQNCPKSEKSTKVVAPEASIKKESVNPFSHETDAHHRGLPKRYSDPIGRFASISNSYDLPSRALLNFPLVTTKESTTSQDPIQIPTLVFIVPYRDRENHLKMFSQTMKTYLSKKQQQYKILYIHQTDNRSFNRGAMKNIGFLAVKKLYPDDYQNITLVFNDVDTMPTNDLVLNYTTNRGIIKHFYGFDFTLGGIVSINASDFESINGFPNFWAWGYEDNLLQIRAKQKNIIIDRSVFYRIHDPRIIHLMDTPIREVNRAEFDRFLQNTTEGIDSINDLEYTVNTDTGFVNVFKFNTTSEEKLENRSNYDLRNGPAPFKDKDVAKNRRAPKMKMNFH